jgi:1,2-diacylglycerol 3-alpha-glucosyltransferase
LPLVIQKTDMHFVIGGKGAEMEKLKNLSKKLNLQDNITFAGFVPDEDLPNLYSVADCFINAGTAELQSLVTMEAMASGLPVMAVNAMALPELVRHGENGYLFQIDAVVEIAKGLIQIFTNEDLRHKMAYKSLEIIRKHDINISMEMFESLYKKMLANEEIKINQQSQEYEINYR